MQIAYKSRSVARMNFRTVVPAIGCGETGGRKKKSRPSMRVGISERSGMGQRLRSGSRRAVAVGAASMVPVSCCVQVRVRDSMCCMASFSVLPSWALCTDAVVQAAFVRRISRVTVWPKRDAARIPAFASCVLSGVTAWRRMAPACPEASRASAMKVTARFHSAMYMVGSVSP